MKGGRSHSIQKVFLEVNVNSEKHAYLIKDGIDDFLKEQLLPQLEEYLESIGVDDNRNLQIASLSISLSASKNFIIGNSSVMPSEISKQVKEQLDTVFVDYLTSEASQLINPDQILETANYQTKTLLHFLETGQFPWWIDNEAGDDVSIDALLYKSVEDAHFYERLETIISKPTVQKRMVYQLSDGFLGIIIQNLNAKGKKLTFTKESNFQKSLARLPSELRHLIWFFLINYALDKPINKAQVSNSLAISFSERPNDVKIQSFKSILKSFEKHHILNPSEREFFDSLIKEALRNLKNAEVGKEVKGQIDRKSKTKSKNQASIESKSEAASNIAVSEKTEHNDTTLKTEDALSEIQKNSALDKIKNSESDELPSNQTLPRTALEQPGKKSFSEENYRITESDSYYVMNAGLILLHPFLKTFFRKCELLSSDNSISNPTLAVHLLHYLATGKEKQYEQLHLVEKFVCGQSLVVPIEREIALSKLLKRNANELLTAVLGHIPQLKSNSIQLFQNEFLQRPGKLILESNKKRLIVERKTQDILLDNLAWNISIIKLPWRKNIFYTDW